MKKLEEPRYRLTVTCVAGGDLIVVIHAKHKTMASLKQAFALARGFVLDDTLAGAQTIDLKTNNVLAEEGVPWQKS